MENKTLVNLTDHDINIDLGDGLMLVLPKKPGRVCRLLISDGRAETIRVQDPLHPDDDGRYHTVSVAVGGAWIGISPALPAPRPGVLYVTSRVVAEHFPERDDLAWPNDLIRDADGRVVAARGLARLGIGIGA